MANIKEQLLFTLNDLESEDLKLFQWYLKNGVEGFCCIPKSQLENTSRLITVDKMVQTYGSDGAVEITLAILKKMNYNQQAEELRTKIRGALKKHELNKDHELIKDHKLTSSQLQEKICSQHDKPIEIYCHTDQRFICYLCMMEEHRGHDTVTAVSGRREKQSFQCLSVSSGSEDSPSISVQQSSFDGVKKSLSDLKVRVEEFCKEEFNKIPPHVEAVQTLPPEPKTREDFLKYYCQLTLDPNTAHPKLILSEMNRVVTRSKTVQPYSVHPERFDWWYQVLSKESVCGRCYWEVEWRGGGGVNISVSYKNISRKGGGYDCVFGRNTCSWSLWCYSSSLSFYQNNIETKIPESPPSRIGVYVDHSAGTLSFYRVSDTMTLLHTVHTTFTHTLCAGFGFDWFSVSLGSTVRLCDLQ